MSEEMMDADAFEDGSGRQITSVGLVIDRSGSMHSMWDEALEGLNQQLRELQKRTWEGDEDTPHDIFVSLISFDNVIEVHHSCTPIAKVEELTKEDISPRGMTALNDAMGKTMDEMVKVKGDDIAHLMITITDGQENASQQVSREDLKNRMEEAEKAGNWTFVFLGTERKSIEDAQAMGVGARNVMQYGGATGQSVGMAHGAVVRSSAVYMSNRTKGVKAQSNFFAQTIEEDDDAKVDTQKSG